MSVGNGDNASASSQTAALPPSEAPSSSSKAAANGATVAAKTPTRSPKASSQAEALPPAKSTSSNGSFGSQAKTSNKPPEAVADVPDERSDRSFVMPSSAAAQVATGVSVANAESAAAADRQIVGGKCPCLNFGQCSDLHNCFVVCKIGLPTSDCHTQKCLQSDTTFAAACQDAFPTPLVTCCRCRTNVHHP